MFASLFISRSRLSSLVVSSLRSFATVPPPSSFSPHGTDFESFDPEKLNSSYPFMTSAIVPRPIALVSTVSGDGVDNVAPFSYFGVFSHAPPIIALGFTAGSDGARKDSLANIDQSGELVVNIVGEWMVDAANLCAGNFPRAVSEFDQSGLSRLTSHLVRPKRVAEAAVQLECREVRSEGVRRTEIRTDAGALSTTVVFARVVKFHIAAPLCQVSPKGDPSVKLNGYKPVGRAGGESYTFIGDIVDLKRPVVDKNKFSSGDKKSD